MSSRINALTINFAPQSLLRSLITAPLVTWLLFLVSMAVCLLTIYRITHYEQSRLDNTQVILRLQSALATNVARTKPAKQTVIPPEQGMAINLVVQQLNLPWSDLFDAIEDSLSPSIALLRIDPDPGKKLIRFQAEAKDADQMITYIEKLKTSKYFSDVRIVRHEVYELDPNRPLRFQFEAGWAKDVK